MSRRSRQWCAHSSAHVPRRCCSMSDDPTEEDPCHYAQWRREIKPPHAHNTICYAQQVEAPQEAHVLLLRGLSKARCSGQAATGVDPGLVRVNAGIGAVGYADCVQVTLFDLICRRPTNTYEETHCASCKTCSAQNLDSTNLLHRTKLRDAELVEPLLRRLFSLSLHESC
jgi:hypothetical protein